MTSLRSDPARGIALVYDLPDGREVGLVIRVFNTMIFIGRAGDSGWQDAW